MDPVMDKVWKAVEEGERRAAAMESLSGAIVAAVEKHARAVEEGQRETVLHLRRQVEEAKDRHRVLVADTQRANKGLQFRLARIRASLLATADPPAPALQALPSLAPWLLPRDVAAAQRTCKTWNRALQHGPIWSRVVGDVVLQHREVQRQQRQRREERHRRMAKGEVLMV